MSGNPDWITNAVVFEGRGAVTSPYHSADLNHNWMIEQSELESVIALYEYRDGTVRTGEYHQATVVEDLATKSLKAVYVAGPGTNSLDAVSHSADIDKDWKISLSELLRVIELKNSQGYMVQEGTEDGFAALFPGAACVLIARDLTIGSTGTDVSYVQKSLGLPITGYFGAQTQDAVRNYQIAKGMTATGFMGAITRDLFNSDFGCAPTTTTPEPTVTPAETSAGAQDASIVDEQTQAEPQTQSPEPESQPVVSSETVQETVEQSAGEQPQEPQTMPEQVENVSAETLPDVQFAE